MHFSISDWYNTIQTTRSTLFQAKREKRGKPNPIQYLLNHFFIKKCTLWSTGSSHFRPKRVQNGQKVPIQYFLKKIFLFLLKLNKLQQTRNIVQAHWGCKNSSNTQWATTGIINKIYKTTCHELGRGEGNGCKNIKSRNQYQENLMVSLTNLMVAEITALLSTVESNRWP